MELSNGLVLPTRHTCRVKAPWNNDMMKSKRYYKTREVAEMLMVSAITVRNWVRSGKLNAERTLGGHRRFLHRDILRFAEENGLKLMNQDDDKLRILIVDDDVELGNYLLDLMDMVSTDTEVKVANDGFVAGGLIQTFSPDVVLLDLIMPGVDGFQVCKAIKQDASTRNIRIVAMTALHSDENIRRIIDEGAEHCLKKPFTPDQLFSVMGLKYESPAGSTARQ